MELGELGEMSFGIMKLGELGEMSFGLSRLGELDKNKLWNHEVR